MLSKKYDPLKVDKRMESRFGNTPKKVEKVEIKEPVEFKNLDLKGGASPDTFNQSPPHSSPPVKSPYQKGAENKTVKEDKSELTQRLKELLQDDNVPESKHQATELPVESKIPTLSQLEQKGEVKKTGKLHSKSGAYSIRG